MASRGKHLGRLQRRADYLAARLACCAEGIDLSYDKAEQRSLLWAIDLLQKEHEPMSHPELSGVWYGPHACEVCGVTIVKAAREDGGAEFEPPGRLMAIFHRGALSHDPDVVYPMTWTPHRHLDQPSAAD